MCADEPDNDEKLFASSINEDKHGVVIARQPLIVTCIIIIEWTHNLACKRGDSVCEYIKSYAKT